MVFEVFPMASISRRVPRMVVLPAVLFSTAVSLGTTDLHDNETVADAVRQRTDTVLSAPRDRTTTTSDEDGAMSSSFAQMKESSEHTMLTELMKAVQNGDMETVLRLTEIDSEKAMQGGILTPLQPSNAVSLPFGMIDFNRPQIHNPAYDDQRDWPNSLIDFANTAAAGSRTRVIRQINIWLADYSIGWEEMQNKMRQSKDTAACIVGRLFDEFKKSRTDLEIKTLWNDLELLLLLKRKVLLDAQAKKIAETLQEVWKEEDIDMGKGVSSIIAEMSAQPITDPNWSNFWQRRMSHPSFGNGGGRQNKYELDEPKVHNLPKNILSRHGGKK